MLLLSTTVLNGKKRLIWRMEQLRVNEQFDNVIFTDESTFSLNNMLVYVFDSNRSQESLSKELSTLSKCTYGVEYQN